MGYYEDRRALFDGSTSVVGGRCTIALYIELSYTK